MRRCSDFGVLVPCAALVVLPASVSAQGSETRPELVEKERIVEASPPPKHPWETAEIGRKLQKRELVAARRRSRALIRISSERYMRVNEDTQLAILPSLMRGRPLGLEIQKGEVYLHSREATPDLGIKTPTVEALPNGTQFMVRVEADGKTTFTMFEGSVELVNAHGRLRLERLEQGVVEPGQAPRRTARIDAKSPLIQWCLYYPGVIHLPELGLSERERADLDRSLAAYRAGDLLGALDRWPAGYQARSSATKVCRAMVLLAVGQVDDARAAMGGVPAANPGRRAIEEMIDAVNFVARPNQREPQTASEWLARSYYEQSRGQRDSLGLALTAARNAAAAAPDFGYAAVRVAELEFSFGRTRVAIDELGRGLQLTPRNAQAYALQGFLLSAQNCIGAAGASFEAAIALDGALGNAWLGRGLCKIRRGQEADGRRDLQTATVLEPNRSLFHSYLGKASSQLGLTAAAMKDLDYAKQLDPNDPTPWLYSALVEQERYRPNAAISDLEESIRRNDNRRLYRSDLLLDQDRAVRSANLAKLYQYNGMNAVAVREATRAVESDYTNASAHLFLANSFDSLRDPTRIELRYETPWFNELLLANLLSPVGGGPLSQYVSQQEYSKLLEADGIGASVTGEFRSNSDMRSTASVFGTSGNVSYGIDASYLDGDGNRFNSDASRTEIYGQFKVQVTPDDVFYFLGKWQDQDSGDNFKTYDNNPLAPGLKFSEDQEPGLLLGAWNHRWGPGSHTLFLGGRLSAEQRLSDPNANQLLLERDSSGMRPGFVFTNGDGFDEYTDPDLRDAVPPPVSLGPDFQTLIYSPALLQAIAPYIGTGDVTRASTAPFSFDTKRKFEIYTAELQHIFQTDGNTLLFGGRYQDGHVDTRTSLSVIRPTFAGGFSTPAAEQESRTDFERTSLYVYDYWNVNSCLTLIGGLSWDRIEHPDNFRNPPVNDGQREDDKLSGKLGFTWSPSRLFTMRGAYTEGLGGMTFDESVRLEPVQLAGFNQAYRTIISESIAGSVETPEYKIWGLSIEGALPSRTWWGASFNHIEQDVDRTLGAFAGYHLGVFPITPAYFPSGTPQRLDYKEDSLAVTLNQLIGDEFSVGMGYRVTRSKLRTRLTELTTVVPGADLTDKATLHELTLFGNWNAPSGLFAHLEANYYYQNLDDDSNSLAAGRDGDDFWHFNAFAGYRFNRNLCEVGVGVLNIGNTDYKLSPLNPYGEIVRDRTAVLRCRFSF